MADQWSSILSVKNEATSVPKPKIPKISGGITSNPYVIRDVSYWPLLVSVGPYYHELKPMEELKVAMTAQYVKDSGRCLDEFCKKVADLEPDARGCYYQDATTHYDSKSLTKMMLLDGCFVLQYIYCFENSMFTDMKMTTRDIALVYRDLFLPENQLPFQVIKALLSLRFGEDEGLDMIYNFTARAGAPPRGRLHRLEIKGSNEPCHLLELVHAQLLNMNVPNAKYSTTSFIDQYRFMLSACSPDPTSPEEAKDSTDQFYGLESLNVHHSVKELKMAGIHFRPSKTSCFTDVNFKSKCISGLLMLPQMVIHDGTKSLLANLLVYEKNCVESSDHWGIASFVSFMHSVVECAEDVEELRSAGIIFNSLHDNEQVVQLFRDLATGFVPNSLSYLHVRRGIRQYYKHKTKLTTRVFDTIHRYFKILWTAIALFGASLAIFIILL